MIATTSLKLPDALKTTIAKVAAFEGKTAHALMVDTLQAAMEDALVRQQFYADGEASYQDTLHSNAVFRMWSVISSPFGRQSWDAMLGANRAVWPCHISDL